MKKILLILALTLLASIPALAESENILSLSTGSSTGFVGFTVERLTNSHSVYLGFGAGLEADYKIAAGYRYYLPDTRSAAKGRSNVYLSPNGGAVFSSDSTWDSDNQVWIDNGYQAGFWGGVTMGYDHRWGSGRQYRLTFEGGLAYNTRQSDYSTDIPIMPVISFSLGYVF